jgi:hypothetical protein
MDANAGNQNGSSATFLRDYPGNQGVPAGAARGEQLECRCGVKFLGKQPLKNHVEETGH